MPNPMTIKGAEDLRAELAHRKGALAVLGGGRPARATLSGADAHLA